MVASSKDSIRGQSENDSSSVTQLKESINQRPSSINVDSSIPNTSLSSTKPPHSVSIPKLFRFCSPGEKFLLVIGLSLSVISGSIQAVVTYFFSRFTVLFVEYTDSVIQNGEANAKALFIVSYSQNVIFSYVSLKLSIRTKEKYYKSLISQDMTFYDKNDSSDLSSKLSSDINALQDGTGVKFGYILQFVSTFLSEIILAMYFNYRMTLVSLSVLPLSSIVGSIMGKYIGKYSSQAQDNYSKSSSIASESISLIKTVISFNSHNIELSRFDNSNKKAQKNDILKIKSLTIGMGLLFFLVFSSYAIALWYGALLVRSGHSTPFDVLISFFALTVSGFSLSAITPSITAITLARSSASKLYAIIDTKSNINPLEPSNGIDASSITGKIDFLDVSFSYPSRPDSLSLSKLSIHASPGQKIALVGSSGSGKSTAIKLIQRFYNPTSGSILIDDVEIQNYDITSLRNVIGVVNQEPILFNASILENILFGYKSLGNHIPSLSDVEKVCIDANIHQFISTLPDKYNTIVGEKGVQLSGGQKQRISIARAMIRKPKILLLDEATSALDSESEKLVQDAIDNFSQNCTVVTVAHRLSTIKDSDTIYVVAHGKVIESGNHQDLLNLNSVYSSLVNSQKTTFDQSSPEQISTKEEKSNIIHDLDKSDSTENINISTDTSPYLSRKLSGIRSFIRLIMSKNVSFLCLLMGSIGALIDGCLFPLFSIAFSKMIFVLGEADYEKQKKNSNFYALLMFLVAIMVFISVTIKTFFFNIVFQKLSKRLRFDLFDSIIHRNPEFFDRKENGTGSLSAMISNDPNDIYSFGSDTLPTILASFSSVITGLIIGFIKGWRLALVALAILPVMMFSESRQAKFLAGVTDFNKADTDKLQNVLSESLQNIRTVASFSIESHFLNILKNSNQKMVKSLLRSYLISSISYGFSQSSLFLNYILMFYAGATFISKGFMTPEEMLNSLYAITLSSVAIGRLTQFLPFMPKALTASSNIVEILSVTDKKDLDLTHAQSRNGLVSGTELEFHYSNRPNIQILKKCTFKAKPGQRVAIVGNSGSGKSTIVSLILKLYQVTSGSLEVDNLDVRRWDDIELREAMAIVSQEPCLFNVSISDNIRYGKPNATQFEIEEASKKAHIHQVILDLPDGYDTIVGSNGDKLSGGQKQRVAIARAIIKDPKILLLDEATSALDYTSEKIVEQSLDSASHGRTTIVVSHRMSTVKTADWIYVLDKGIIVEQGKHDDLIKLDRVYSKLVELQNL
ncbi:Multidrug resistance protein 1 [Smittium culicis]|uniref:Multidrug resistance protein 1 n=1 Tax=Smittium culicis TaxID=133412 RepID=A0A1R1YHP8_9FUNG|nr:Multidrug resistance protein 1 [Smittium culicis]